MSDYEIPDLPSDEELGIDGESLEDYEEEPAAGGRNGDPPVAAPPAEPPPRPPKGRAPAAPSPPRPWRGPVTLVVLVVVGFLSRMDALLPGPGALDAPDSVFSSARAMMDMAAIARTAHPPGSPEHARVRGLLVDRLAALGLQPEIQTELVLRRRDEQVSGATVRNVLARIPGTASTGAIVVTAHYDSRGLSRGAGDDGSGVVTILETLRALRSLPPLRNDLIVLLTDAEELGLLGARAFVDEHPWMEDVALVLSVEMRGGGGPSLMFETGEENGWIIDALGDGDPRPAANSLSYEVYRRMPNDTDFTPFREAGVQGLNFAAAGNPNVYHQQYDAPEHFDERTLQHHGLHLLGMVRELGERDLTSVDGPDRVFFRLPLLGLVTYPPAVAWALAAVLLLGMVVVFALVRRAGPAVAGTAAGFGIAVATVALTAAAAHFLRVWVQGFHPEHGALHGSAFHVEGWYVAATVAGGTALLVIVLHLARRRFGLGALTLGAAVLPVAGGVALAIAAPLGAMNLQWPALFMLASAALVARTPPGGRMGIAPWIMVLVLTAATMVFVVPLTELLWVALSFEAAAIVGGVAALSLVSILPALDALREPGGGWAPVLGVVLAAAFVGVGVLHARPAPDRPAPSTLLYALDRDDGRALWATSEDGGEAWAAQRTGAEWNADSVQALEDHLMGDRTYLTAPAEAVAIPGPGALVSVGSGEPGGGVVDRGGDGGVGGGVPSGAPPSDAAAGPGGVGGAVASVRRTLGLTLRSRAGAEVLALVLPSGPDVFLRRINGRDVPDQDPEERSGARRVRTFVHYGAPEGVLEVELDVGGTVDTLDVELVEHHLRPWELVGESWFLRPPTLAPNIVTRSDRAVLRGTVRIVTATGAILAAPAQDPATLPVGAAEGPARPDTAGGTNEPPAADTGRVRPDSAAASPDTTVLPPDTAGRRLPPRQLR